MKKINILLIATIALLTASCDKFLDIEPVGRVIPKTYNDFRGVMTSAYNTVSADRSLITLRGDEAYPNNADRIKDIFIWNDTEQNPANTYFSWAQSYKVILHTNNIIADGPTATGATPELVNQLLGEAYLLRAYIHFNLVNVYADSYGATDPKTTLGIPIATKVDITTRYKRNTVEEVYTQILGDIEEAFKLINLDQQPSGYNYRFSKISAYGFAARVYLAMNNFEKAAEFASKALAINNRLEDFNTKFTLPYTFKSVENVLALERTIGSNITNDMMVSEPFIQRYYVNGDLRLTNYFSTTFDGIKVNAEDKPEYRVSMRTAELYLIKAESIARSNGNLDDAKATLKILLKNRLKPDYYTQRSAEIDAMDRTTFVQTVFDERARELALQGFRWFDLKRNGKPQIIKQYSGQTYTLKQNDPRYVVRIPQEAVINNPNLAE